MTNQVTVFAPDLEQYRATALTAAMDRYVALAMRDSRPPTQRASDVLKAAEAAMMLDETTGFVSDLIVREAEMRSKFGQKITPIQLARLIRAEASRLQQIELDRVEVSLRLSGARTHEEIFDILAQFGIEI